MKRRGKKRARDEARERRQVEPSMGRGRGVVLEEGLSAAGIRNRLFGNNNSVHSAGRRAPAEHYFRVGAISVSTFFPDIETDHTRPNRGLAEPKEPKGAAASRTVIIARAPIIGARHCAFDRCRYAAREWFLQSTIRRPSIFENARSDNETLGEERNLVFAIFDAFVKKRF